MRLGLLFTLLLVGCSTKPFYTWEKVRAPATHINYWVVDNPEQYTRICGEKTIACSVLYLGKHCDIFSMLNDTQLQWRKDWDGMPIKEHEEKHCAGWVHNELEVR